MNIKLLSLNLHCGMEENYELKMKAIITGLKEENPDFIVLQECIQHKDAETLYSHYGVDIKKDNMAFHIKDKLHVSSNQTYEVFFDWGKYGFNCLEEGLAILSKYKIISATSRYVSDLVDINNWKSRKIIRLETMIDGVIVFIYSVHLGWWDDGEELFTRQMNNLYDWIKEKPEGIHILAGDFNNYQGSLGYHHMMDLGLIDLYYKANKSGFHDETFIEQAGQGAVEGVNINKRIDYILTPNTRISPVMMERIFTKERYGIVSDHYGLVGVIDI